jgi:hypothetical protein
MIAELIPEELHPHAVFAIKATHLLAFLIIQTAIFFLIYKGLRRETDKRAGIALAIAAGETLIYAGNGFRCPLTGLAEDLGAEDGSVTGVLLPRWLAMNIVNIYGPLLALGLALHARNLIRPLVRRPRLLRLPRRPTASRRPARRVREGATQ